MPERKLPKIIATSTPTSVDLDGCNTAAMKSPRPDVAQELTKNAQYIAPKCMVGVVRKLKPMQNTSGSKMISPMKMTFWAAKYASVLVPDAASRQ